MTAKTKAAASQSELLQRLSLAPLDQYVCEKKGYDPYDTMRGRSPDIWSTKRKRA